MMLKGHFDGLRIVLDEPVPPALAPSTPVTIAFDAPAIRTSRVDDLIGSWWMDPEETRQFLADVELMRHMDTPDRAIPPEYKPRGRAAE